MTEGKYGPGIYPDITEADYHADPAEGGSLSNSTAALLLPPSAPAVFKHRLDYPTEGNKKHFDFGHAAHRLVLGAGAEIVEIKADSYRTKKAKEDRDIARSAGNIPLLSKDVAIVEAMAEAIQAHPVASALLAPELGRPEVTLIWDDPATGVRCRARLDWLRTVAAGVRRIQTDYKSTASGDLESLAKSVYNFGYYRQAPWYLDGLRALGLDPDETARFVFIAQEKEAPYLVTIFELDSNALWLGRDHNTRARHIYKRCLESGEWPAYDAGEVAQLSLPGWVLRKEGLQ